MRYLLYSLVIFTVSHSALAVDFLQQANIDYLGMVKKVKIVQEIITPNEKFKYVHLRAYTDENSENEYWETVYRLNSKGDVTARLISAGEIKSSGYISNFLGDISRIQLIKPGVISIVQKAPQSENSKKYFSSYQFVDKSLKLIKLTLIQPGIKSKVLIDKTVPRTRFLKEAVQDYMFIDSITAFKIVTKILSHDGSKTYIYGRAISPTKFDDPKWWDTIYTIDNNSGKIISRLIDGSVVAGESNLRYFMGQVKSISLTKSGFLEIKQGPSRLKDDNYSIIKYEDRGEFLKIISIEAINEDGSRYKYQ